MKTIGRKEKIIKKKTIDIFWDLNFNLNLAQRNLKSANFTRCRLSRDRGAEQNVNFKCTTWFTYIFRPKNAVNFK